MANEFGNKRFSGKEYACGTLPNEYYYQQIDIFKPGNLLLPEEVRAGMRYMQLRLIGK